jgi:hypothetical protein
MTDYRQKYENERSARKLAEKEVELLKKEIELLKMQLNLSSRERSPQVSQESESESSDSSESEDEAPKFTRIIRKKKDNKQSSHDVIIKPVENTLKDIIHEAIDNMGMSDFNNYATNMETNSAYEINLFESIISNLPKKQVPILITPDGRYNVYDEEKGERKWVVCDLNRLVEKTYGRIHNMILKMFNDKGKMKDLLKQSEIAQCELMSTLGSLCKIEGEKLLKSRSRALAKMFKN